MYSPTSVLKSPATNPLGPGLAGPTSILRQVPGRPPIATPGSVSYVRQPAQPSTGRFPSPTGVAPQIPSYTVVPVKPIRPNNPGPPPATHLEEPPGNELPPNEEDTLPPSDAHTNGAQSLLAKQQADQYFRERRPTDPFFYPTTINPLTDLGISAIESTLPPHRSDGPGMFSHAAATFQLEEPAPLFVNAPIQSFVDQPDEMNVLQQQNDSLARQVQALEHAKSLAQVQQAQASERIRSRQEQLRKESQQAILRAKEMQADISVGGSQPSGTPLEFASPLHQTSPVSPAILPSMALMGGQSTGVPSVGSPFSRAGEGLDHGYRDNFGEVDVYDGMPSIGESKPKSPDVRDVFRDRGVVRDIGITKDFGIPNVQGTMPSQISGAVSFSAPSHTVPEMGYSDRSPYELADNPPPHLPTEDVNPNDIQGLANRILDAHKSPSAPNSLPAPVERYVDALGNPLGPLTFKEFPNIKDDITSDKLLATVGTWQENISFGAQAQGLTPDVIGGPVQLQPISHHAGLVTVDQQPCLRGSGNDMSSLQPPPKQDSWPYPEMDVQQPEVQQSQPQYYNQDHLHQSLAHHHLDGDGTHADHTIHADHHNSEHASDRHTAERHVAERHAPERQAGHGSEHFPQDRHPQQHQKTAPHTNHQTLTAEGEPEAAVDSEELQVQLEQCLETISVCGESITKENLQEITAFTRPPSVVKDVVEACCLLLGNTDMRWANIKKFISTKGFLEKLKSFKFQQSVTKELYKKLSSHLAHPDFDEEIIKSVCVAVVPMAMWCRAIGVYLSKTKYRGGPDIRPVAHAANPQWITGDQAPAHHGEDPYFIFEPDIEKMRPEELTAVSELTITRPGTGSITFHGLTDCTELDFEKIVRLEVGEVLVYPEPGMKPPVGVGLNKQATVTMYQCWPPTGSKLLQDTKSQERYCRKIQQMTEQKNATFIDYDCASGIWKFRVDHF